MEETTPVLHLYDVAIRRYRKEGGAQFPDFVSDGGIQEKHRSKQ